MSKQTSTMKNLVGTIRFKYGSYAVAAVQSNGCISINGQTYNIQGSTLEKWMKGETFVSLVLDGTFLKCYKTPNEGDLVLEEF